MSSTVAGAPDGRPLDTTTWSPARIYLVVSGVFLVLIPLAGFFFDHSFPIGADAVHRDDAGHIFGILETNGWHNLAGLLSGAIALGFAIKPHWARTGALFKGFMYVGVTTSIAIWGPEKFWLESNTADQIVHATLAVTGLIAGFATPARSRTG
jgi:hypothetical protein